MRFRGFPNNPKLWDRHVYLDPVSGCQYVTYEWIGVLGWQFISCE